MLSNEEIVEGFIRNDRKVIIYIYKTHFPIITGWIKKNSGSVEDAGDIFHEGFIVILRRIKDKDLSLESSFSTYLFAICKNLWFQQLRKKSKIKSVELTDLTDPIETDTANEIEEMRLIIYLKQFNLLESKCKQLLLLYRDKKSLPEIMQIMGFKNTQAVADKKKNCRKKLIDNVMKCKEYKELYCESLINN
jgi:RNA polymerase sigma factor (sigma-70 family)